MRLITQCNVELLFACHNVYNASELAASGPSPPWVRQKLPKNEFHEFLIPSQGCASVQSHIHRPGPVEAKLPCPGNPRGVFPGTPLSRKPSVHVDSLERLYKYIGFFPLAWMHRK